MTRSTETGRARIVAMVALVVVIGALGAIALPRLLHNTATSGRGPGSGHVCLALPFPDGLESAGTIRITSRAPGRKALDVRTTFERGTTQAELLDAVLRDAHAAGWTHELGVQMAGTCLALGAVRSIGGDPGRTGAAMAFGVASRGRRGIAPSIQLEGSDIVPEGAGPRVVVTLVARSVVDTTSPDVASADVVLEMTWSSPIAILDELARHLDEAGWTIERGAAAGVVVRAMPEGRSIGSALLTVFYDASESTGETKGSYLWSFDMAAGIR